MNMFRSRRNLVTALFFAVIVAGFFLGGMVHVHAATTVDTAQPANGFSDPYSGGIYYISLAINSFLGIFISMGAAVIKAGLTVNANVFSDPTVQKGFSITLALANLGFVIGIIVIALATILRNQTYGIKQLLWKLVVMAILVNFGLVITAPILGFANNISNYFLVASSGTSGDANGFVTNLTAAFQVNKFGNPPEKANGGGMTGCAALNAIGGPFLGIACSLSQAASAKDTTGIGGFFKPLMGLLFSAVFETIVVITFWAIAILLLVRYAYIAILLILLPLAWLTWIFPKFGSSFDKWWQEFLRWTFFPAITLFFIYLAFQSVALNGSGNVTVPKVAIPTSGVNGPEGAAVLATDVASTVQTGRDDLLLCALCLGGLFAANSIGIRGAGTAIGVAKSTGKSVSGYVGRRGRQAATAPLRGQLGRKITTRLQQPTTNNRILNPLLKYTGLDWAKSRAARGLEAVGVAGGEHAAKAYDKDVAGLTRDQVLNQLSTSNAMRRQALMARVDKEDMHDDARAQRYMGKENEAEFNSYGNGKMFDSLRTKSGFALVEAIKDGKDDEAITDQVKKIAAKNPEALSSFFMNNEAFKKVREQSAKKGIALPVTLQPESLQSARREIAKAFSGLSPTNANSFLTEISKKNNLGEFEKAVTDLDPATREGLKNKFAQNDALKRWIIKGSHRTLLDLNSLYGLNLEEESENSKPKISSGSSNETQAEIDARGQARAATESERERVIRERGQQV